MKNKRYLRIMALLAIFAVILSFSVPVCAENEYELAALTAEGEVTIESLNVRQGPGTEYEAIGLVREGETVTITGQADNGWYQITYQGEAGFVSGKYITIIEEEMPAEEPIKTSARIDLEPFVPLLLILIILAVLVMMFFTVRSFKKDASQKKGQQGKNGKAEEYEAEEYETEEEEEYGTEEDGEYETEEEDKSAKEKDFAAESTADNARTVVIREEDYQLHIDPKYFEDDEPIEQPESIYDSQKEEPGDLQKAMAKLEELQEEIERLKMKQESEK